MALSGGLRAPAASLALPAEPTTMPHTPPSLSRTLVVLLAGISSAAAADGGSDMSLEYTYEEQAAGKDIHEAIYGSHGDGEFDEWRLHLGAAPGLDRIQLKTLLNGQPYPGPGYPETDRVINEPFLAPQIGLTWVLGDYERADQGWFYTLGLEYTRRDYTILYGLGADSAELRLNAVTAGVGMGYAWYLNPHWRFEINPFATMGAMWNELDLIDTQLNVPNIRRSRGVVVEVGVRNSLIWHPAKTQEWHLGGAVDYRSGYAQTIFHDENPGGKIDSEVRLWWYGFGYSIFYGQKF